MKRALASIFWILLYIAVVLGALGLMRLPPQPDADRPFLIDLAIALGFLGLAQIALQFLLIARSPSITKPYGIDVIMKYHREIGFATSDGRPGDGASDRAGITVVSGRRLYEAHCASCHGAGGEGRAGFAPPLSPIGGRLLAAPGGREYLIDFMRYGLRGEVVIDGAHYRGGHPPFERLSDEQIAALLNEMLRGMAAEPYGPDDIAGRRGQSKSGEDVHRSRPRLDG